ncbi:MULTISPECIES: AfsR/SARP family transcriptional regulator [unclassified Nocardiopsis]|uniref:AfsR/SARP family transcriptional regulator n=1 Tax=Nocardiopsis TaxID=2013 RepID=UPI00387A858B
MKVKVLGYFEVSSNGARCTPKAPKVRQVLALLALRSQQIVGLESLIEELWSEHPPRSAVTTTQTYVYQLRKSLLRLEADGRPVPALHTTPPGYTFDLEREHLDVFVFDELTRRGRALFEEGDAAGAAQVLEQALSLWSGPALGNVNCGPLLRRYTTHLEEQRSAALELRIAADMELGRYRHLIPELKSLVVAQPLNEWLHSQLIKALHQLNRRGEALRAYQDLRRILTEELGLDPSPEVQRIQQHVLSSTAP